MKTKARELTQFFIQNPLVETSELKILRDILTSVTDYIFADLLKKYGVAQQSPLMNNFGNSSTSNTIFVQSNKKASAAGPSVVSNEIFSWNAGGIDERAKLAAHIRFLDSLKGYRTYTLTSAGINICINSDSNFEKVVNLFRLREDEYTIDLDADKNYVISIQNHSKIIQCFESLKLEPRRVYQGNSLNYHRICKNSNISSGLNLNTPRQ